MNGKNTLFLHSCILTFTACYVCGDSWLVGCYHGEPTDVHLPETLLSLVPCARRCLEKQVALVGVRRGENCVCLGSTSGLQRQADRNCSTRCPGVSRDLRLPCGEDSDSGDRDGGVWSVYTSAGPYLLNVTARVSSRWVVPDAPVTLEATATLAAFSNFTHEDGLESEDGCVGNLHFVWDVEGAVERSQTAACGARTSAHVPFTFILPGQFSIDVTVSNGVSSVHTNLVVTVLTARPHGLQLLPRHPPPRHLPSCLQPALPALPPPAASSTTGDGTSGSESAAEHGAPAVVAVFANASFQLEAGVGAGQDLRYVITVRDSARKRTVSRDIVRRTRTRDSAACISQGCQQVLQTLAFGDPGLFAIHVNVSNEHGWEEQSLTVVVMERRLGEVQFYLRDGEVPALPTGHTVTFHLTLVTTDRHNTFLHVDFADGHVQFAPLRERKNETDASEDDGGDEKTHFGTVLRGYGVEQRITGLHLVASYGHGCQLVVVFEHTYEREGTFLPHVWIHNNVTETMVTQALAAAVIVQNRLTEAKMQAPSAITMGTTADFYLPPLQSSVWLTVNWVVTGDSDNVMTNITTPSTNYSTVFTQTGVYRVWAQAWNLLDRVEAGAIVTVQTAVEGLRLLCSPSPPHLTVEDELSCVAEAGQGSQVTFTWNFQDVDMETDVVTTNLTSHATHTYLRPGVYNVSVTATNQVSRSVAGLRSGVTVDMAIRCLRADTSGPVSPGEEVYLVATALSGTCVRFQFDFGLGWWAQYGDMEVELTRTTAVTSHTYTQSGLHPVTVFARNNISSANLTTHIVVQPKVGSVKMVLQPSTGNSNAAVFVVQQHGEVVRRQDLVFYLRVSDGPSIVSRSPILETNFSHTGNHTVNLTAFNEVDGVSDELHVDDAKLNVLYEEPRLVHPAVVALVYDQPVHFTLLNIPDGARVVEVRYSDGAPERFAAATTRWSHVFTSPGVHTAEVAIFGGGGGGARRVGPPLHTTLVLQQPITGLHLAGPSHVGIHCYNVWHVELSGGSHLVCQWSLGGEREDRYTTSLTYTRGFGAEGVYTLGVHCHNDVSSMWAALNVTVNHPVANVHLHIPVAVHGRPAIMIATVSAGRHFLLSVDYGDGGREEFLSTQLRLVSTARQLPAFREAAPAFNVTLEHVYRDVGVYEVTVTVSNTVDSLTRCRRVVVEEAIAGITLFTNAKGIVPVTDKVTVTAVVASGENLHFEWDFSDMYRPLSVDSEGNRSTAVHKYDVAGLYAVTVKVSNHLQEAVTARLPFPIEVQEPVAHIKITQILNKAGQKGANFSILTNRSDMVTIDARSDGDPVTYLFDFGDGTSRSVDGVVNLNFMMYARVSHTYDREGTFTVSVTGSNALSNATAVLSESLFVQEPVMGPLLHRKKYCTLFGEETVLQVQPSQGTNVTFTWRLDDETELVNVGNIARHTYRDRGVATVQVTASNQVSSITDFADVDVVEQIQSVTVDVASLVVAAGQPMAYTALVVPERQGSTKRYYQWDFERKTKMTEEPNVTYAYQHSGRFRITVTAHNCQSNATSVPIAIHVVACLVDLQIDTVGDNLVGQPIKFMALTYQGDFLNFTWNFGDDTPPWQTQRNDIWHTFNRTGEYQVSLLAENPLGRDTTTQRIFILTQVCKPPSVTIVGLTHHPVSRPPSGPCELPWPVHAWCQCANEKKLTSQRSYVKQMSRWQALRVESQVSVNCSVSSDLTYTWQLSEEGAGGVTQVWDEYTWAHSKGLDTELLHHPLLVLPPHTLPSLSRFILTLKVSINATEIPVYQVSQVHVNVAKSPLESVIHGGILRRVSQNDNVTLDGTRSRDPDNSSTPLSYQWGCQLLKFPALSCFNHTLQDLLPPLNTSRVTLPAAWFSMEADNYLFNLTVTASDMVPAVSTQVVSVTQQPRVIPLAVECLQCHRNWVNANNKVSLVARCVGEECWDLRLRYTWQVFVVTSSSPEDDSADADSACVAANGSSYLHLVLANTTTTPATTTTISTTTTTTPTTTTFSVLSGSNVLPAVPDQSRDLLPPWQNMQENPGPPSRTDNYRRGQSSRNMGRVPTDFYPEPAEGMSGSQRLGLDGPPLDIGEGMAGGSGSAQGRKLGGFHEPKEQPGDARYIQSGLGKPESPQSESPSCLDGEPNCVRFVDVKPVPPHITTLPRYTWSLNPSQVASDPHGPSLVLRPGTLRQGWTYLVQVTASSPDRPEAEGVAMTYFRVNKSPRNGACSVVPLAGVEMDTVFRVFCKEWRDEQLPVWYEVSYSLDGGEELGDTSSTLHIGRQTSSSHRRHFIYRGLSHQVNFRLPAGLPSRDHKVLLHLAIQDDWGAATTICHIAIPVTPQQQQQHQGRLNVTTITTDSEDSLCHEVSALSTHLSTSVYRGDVTGIQDSSEVLCHLAARLNRLPYHTVSSSDGNCWPHDAISNADDNNSTAASKAQRRRAGIRAVLVLALQAIPMRDEVELIKTLHCLMAVTSVVSQVDGRVLVNGLKLLESVRTHASAVYGEGGGVSDDLVGLTVQVVSNLVRASTQGLLLQGSPEDSRHRQTQRAINVLDGLLTLSLSDHTLGETPVRHATDFITLAASHYHSHHPTSIRVGTTTFKLPLHMAPVLRVAAAGVGGEGREERDCFQARATAFQHNPYAYRNDQLAQVQSEVVSLDMFTCEGEKRLVVENLQPNNNVEIVLPLTTTVETAPEYQMSRSQMSIHHFNISQTQKDMYLTLLVNLSVLPDTHRPFPITAIISQSWPPHPQHNLYRHDFPLDKQQLGIFFSPGSLSGAGSYYLGLMETSLNSGQRRQTEVTTRNYTLSVWFGSCLFWNESLKSWSDSGCRVANTITTTATHCMCSHLTSFGSHFELIPNDLSFTDLQHFFTPHENPAVLILVGVLVLVYILLLTLARRADNHDLRKGGMVCLSDNNVTDTQLYEVILLTGQRQHTPTTAKISIILHGEHGMSETRELISEDDRPMFEHSSNDRFLLTLPDSLGRIVKVQLWHNNAGSSPRWFLGQVIVRDLNTGRAAYFLVDKWFAVDEGDGRVEREVLAADNVTFTQILITKGREYLADYHLWSSVFTCPPHTPFTRAQRLTCCLTLMLAYMALNATWYQQQPEKRRGEFGLLDVSWRSVTVGAICCAVIFPLHLFLTFLFRRSKASHWPCDRKVDVISKPSAAGSSMMTHGGGDDGVGVDVGDTLTTYSLLDQSILNWQSIQDWAQRQWVKRQQSSRSSANSVKNNAPLPAQPPAQPVQHTLLAGGGEEDQASSGFEDAVSQATAERNRIRAASHSSSEGQQSHLGDGDGGGRQIFLPSWCRYVAWVLCALICTFSATVTVLYGFRFGPVKSVLWLQSLYFSFMVCVFLAQPVWILASVVWVAVWNRNNPAVLEPSNHGDTKSAVDAWHSHQKQVLDNTEEGAEMERGVRARQRSRYLRFARPPQEKVLQETRKKLVKERNAANFLREVTVFLLMFTLVCIMAYGKDLAPHYRLHHSLQSVLLRGGDQDFNTISSVREWHQWAQTTLLDAVFGTNSTAGFMMKAGAAQSNTVMVGHPYLRQLRILPQPCPATPYITQHALCRHGSNSVGDGAGQHYAWSGPPPGGSMVWGHQAVYDAGGFVVPLNCSSKQEAASVLSQLESEGWVDRQTRAIVVEITLLNAPTNLFSAVQLLLELPASGGVFPLATITSTCLFRYITAWDNCVLACELLFVLLAMVRTQSELSTVVQQGRAYFTWPWNYAQAVLCVTSLAYVACYIYRFVLVGEAVEFLRSTFYEQFVSLAFLAAWDELLRWLVGLLVFLVVMTQGLQLVRYCPHLAKFPAIYRRARREIVLMMMLFVVLTAAFSTLGSALFATVSFGMRNVWSSALTVTALFTGISSTPDLQGETALAYNVMTIFFTMFGAGFLTAYSVAVLTYRLRVYKSSDVLIMGKCELLDYTLQQLLLFVGVRKLTPVHEPEIDLPPECTLAEFEYQVEELLFRMNALAGTTNLPEKPAGYLTDSDQSQAIGDDGISSGGSEAQVERSGGVQGEGEGRLEQRVQKIEDKLYANEPYLAQLLKLDSIGADVLSQEKEKQLRSHLEMEIFRQLQMRRQETGHPTMTLDALPASNTTTTITIMTAAGPCSTITQPHQQLQDTGPEPWPQHRRQTECKGQRADRGQGAEERGQGLADRGQGAADRGQGSADRGQGATERGQARKEEVVEKHVNTKQLPAPAPGPCSASEESPGSETVCILSCGDDQDGGRATSYRASRNRMGVGCVGMGCLGGLVAGPADCGVECRPSYKHNTPNTSHKHHTPDMSGSHHTPDISHKHHTPDTEPPDVTSMQRKDSRGSRTHPLDTLSSGLVRGGGKKHGSGEETVHGVSTRPGVEGLERADSMRFGKKILADLTSGMERSDSLRGAGKKHMIDSSMERSDSLRGAGKKHVIDSNMERSDSVRVRKLASDLVPSGMERSDSLRSAGRKPELPPKPTFAQSVLPSLESRRSPKLPPLKLPSQRILHRVDVGTGRVDVGGSGLLGESSSGSEQDAVFTGGMGLTGSSRRSQGQGRRNLRKTKSRGKGKGAGTLTPTLLLDELSFTVHTPPKDVPTPAGHC